VLKTLSIKRTNNPVNKWANKVKRQFSEEVLTANNVCKSVFLAIKEVYITTTLTFHLTHDGMAIIKKTNNKNSL
jgi:hypothetical protein